jgi:WD40 repeat protein/DNA-binding SARP family transcriptional activator
MHEAVGTGVTVHLLGPLEVWSDGRPVRLSGTRQRALLALLALHADEVVTSERLVEMLFGLDAAASAVNAVQVAVSRLRRLLGNDSVETRPGGYLLHLTPGGLDIARFEHELAEGRRLLESGKPVEAAGELRAALELFRGAPLSDLASFEFAQVEIRRLEELKVAALMERIDADLAVGRSAELVAELEALVREQPLQERLCGQLMLALYRCGRQADALDVYRRARDFLHDELGLEPSRGLQELQLAILRHDEALDPQPSAVTQAAVVVSDPVVCPFKGLAPFTAADAAFFSGRERLVDELLARLVTSTFVGLVGPSGSGKSSLLQAGLLPALARGALPGSVDWRQLLLRPGNRDRLDVGFAPEGRVVIAVDQLEELFTTANDDGERASFLQTLATAALDPDRRYIVAVALRADFYGRCAAFPGFAALLSANHILLGPMKRDELVRAIKRPAHEAGLEVERELVDSLVADLNGEPGGLPLLSTTLLELWRERDGRVITEASYRLSGGVRGAVARLAERAYSQLTEPEQAAARGILLRLVADEEDTVVRRRVPLDEFDLAAGSGAARVVSVLTDARLLTISEGTIEVSHEALLSEWPRLRGWLDEDRDGRRLRAHIAGATREWAERGRDPADLYRGPRLASALELAEQPAIGLNRLEREFVDESRLASERETVRQRRQNRRLKILLAGVGGLLALAVVAGGIALVARSNAQHEATVALSRQLGAEAVSEPRIDRAMLLAREAVNLNRSTQTEGTLLATLLRSPAAVGTFTLPIESRPQKIALSPDGRTLAVSDNRGTVRLYDTATRRVRSVLPNLGFTYAVAYTPDGSRFAAVGGADVPEIDVVNTTTLRTVRVLHFDRQFLTKAAPGFARLLVTPDGRSLLYAYDLLGANNSDGPTYVDKWDLGSGRLISTAPVGIIGATDANLVDRGRQLAVGGTKAVAILDARTLRHVRTVPLPSPNPINDDVVSPGGQTIAIGTAAGSVSFIDVATGRVTPGVGGHTAAVQAMRFSPDGRVVVTSSDDGNIIVWDPATGQPVERLVGHAGRVHGLAFSRDGRTLFSNSLDGAIFEWGLGGGERFGTPFVSMRSLPQFGPDVPETPPLAVSPGGSQFAVRVGRSSVALYTTSDARPLRHFAVDVGGDVTSMAWSSRGALVLTGENGQVQLWDTAGAPRPRRRLAGLASTNGQPETVVSAAFSPAGSLVAAGDVNHTPAATPYRLGSVAVWDAASGRLLWKTTSKNGTVNAIAFSPDGTTIAVGYEDGTLTLYAARSGRPDRVLHLEGGSNFPFETLRYAPDGTLATGTWAGVIQLWNPASGTQIGHPTLVAAAPVASIAFDAAGDSFATTGGSDGLAKIWTTSTQQQFGATFPGDPGQWGNAQYTPDGSRLIVVYQDGKGYIWPATVRAWENHACAVAGRNFTAEEWGRYVHGHPYTMSCPQFPHG